MTIENELYGSGWHRCGACGVKDRADQLDVIDCSPDGIRTHRHIAGRAAKCVEWKAILAKAAPADLDVAAAATRAQPRRAAR